LLLPQALPHLRPERRPIVGADVRFETRRSSAQIVVNIASLPSTLTVLCGAVLVRAVMQALAPMGRWCLHLHGHRRLGCPAAGSAISAHNPNNCMCR